VTTSERRSSPVTNLNIVKVKPPSEHIERDDRKALERAGIPTNSVADRVGHVVQSCFDGRRIAIFSGGEAKDDKTIPKEARGIGQGGGFGSIIGGNFIPASQREAVRLLHQIMDNHAGAYALAGVS
jgi:fructose-bisphosphate aldolase, class I